LKKHYPEFIFSYKNELFLKIRKIKFFIRLYIKNYFKFDRGFVRVSFGISSVQFRQNFFLPNKTQTKDETSPKKIIFSYKNNR